MPPSRSAILRALKATAPVSAASGGFSSVTPPSIGTGPSPLVASYNEWTSGRAAGENQALPRDWMTFLSGMFGPLAPIRPMPVDTPAPGEERPEPRRWQYPVGWDMPSGAPGTEGVGKLADFSTLRTIADLYSVARACVDLRKSEIRGIRWDIASTKDAAKAMRNDHAAMRDFAERRAKAMRFFRRPDPQYRDFSSWMDALLEEVFVTDALSVFPHPPRGRGKGVLGSNIATLELIDGSTIKPLVDVRGATPLPPNVGYQQFLFGVPRVDLMTLILGDDIPDGDSLAAEYRSDQLMYLPSHPRTWTPYGQAGVEKAIIPIMTGIQKQKYSMNFFTEGTIPGLFVSPGDPNMTPNQIRELQDALNALAGDQAWKHKIIVLPGGSKVDPQKPVALADQFDEIVMLQTCMAFDIMPMELGILPNVSATVTPSTATMVGKASQQIHQRKSTTPLLEWLSAAIFNVILQDVLGQEDMEWRWEGLEEAEDEEALTGLLVAQVESGLSSIDEARMELGKEPWGLPITQDPGWGTQYGGFQPLTAISMTALPAGPGQQGKPGQQQPGQPAPAPKPGAGSREMPGELPPTGQTKQPRNQMSRGQRGKQSDRIGAAQQSPLAQTPAHSAAQAAHAGTTRAGGRQRSAKGAARELGLLRGHLRRGESASDWEPRELPGHVLAMITEDVAKGIPADIACDLAASSIGKGEAASRSGPRPADGLAAEVYAYLAKHYPASVLEWVEGAAWHEPAMIGLEDIQMARRPGGARDQAKVKAIAESVAGGKKLRPVVLVREPDADRYEIADGWHRALGVARAGEKEILAWAGDVSEDGWPGSKAINEKKLNKAGGARPKGPESDSGSQGSPGLPLSHAPSRGAAASHPSGDAAVSRPDGNTQWPGWYTDAQLAAEYAQQLAAALAAGVNAGQLARDWLALNEVHRRRRPQKKRRKAHQAVRPAPLAQPPPPPAQQQAQSVPAAPPPAPHAFLVSAGAAAAVLAMLTAILAALWQAAWMLGWGSAAMVTGSGEIPGDEEALAALLAGGHGRLAGILQTRMTRLERALMDGLRDGLEPDELAGEIAAILGSQGSALLVTQSETSWASGQAAFAAYKKAGIKYVKWQTRNDSRVCFPAWTPVATPCGPVPIESLRRGDLVSTPAGSRRIRAVSARPYSGGVTVIETERSSVAATDSHPFMTDAGWRRAGDLRPGDRLQALGDELVEIARVVHLGFGDPQDMPSVLREEGILNSVSLDRKLVPVIPVRLDYHAQADEHEIDGPLPDIDLLREILPQMREGFPDAELQHGFSGESAIAPPAAEPPGGTRGLYPEPLTALCAVNVNGGPAALLGAEVPIETLLCCESPSAALAVDVFREGGLAGLGAHPVPRGHRDVDREIDFAHRTGPGDLPACLEALGGTVRAILPAGTAPGVEDLPAAEASLRRVLDSSGVVAVSRAEDTLACSSARVHSGSAAAAANIGERHNGPSLSNNSDSWNTITVYNIEVEDEHVYYAGGFLVHNCQICLKNQKAGSIPTGTKFPSGLLYPLQHPRCRCVLLPAAPPKAQPGATGKSAETPMLEATPHLLGPHGLWHTPSKKVPEKQKLPNYVEHIAAALMRDKSLDESTAIAYAINAIKRWAKGDLHWGKGKVSPEVRAASQRALAEWKTLRASHDG